MLGFVVQGLGSGMRHGLIVALYLGTQMRPHRIWRGNRQYDCLSRHFLFLWVFGRPACGQVRLVSLSRNGR